MPMNRANVLEMLPEDTDLNDPLDAYDPTDPPRVLLLNFIRRIGWLQDRFTRLDADVTGERLQMLVDDIETLRQRLAD